MIRFSLWEHLWQLRIGAVDFRQQPDPYFHSMEMVLTYRFHSAAKGCRLSLFTFSKWSGSRPRSRHYKWKSQSRKKQKNQSSPELHFRNVKRNRPSNHSVFLGSTARKYFRKPSYLFHRSPNFPYCDRWIPVGRSRGASWLIRGLACQFQGI